MSVILVKTPIFSDSFNRANENPLNPLTWNENPQSPPDHCIIQSDVCYAVNNADLEGVQFPIATYPRDQYFEYDVVALPTGNNGGPGGVFRINLPSSTTFLFVELNGAAGFLLEGELANLIVPVTIPAVPFHMFCGVISNTHYFSINSGPLITTDISTLTASTSLALGLFLSPFAINTDTGVQNFVSGALSIAPATVSTIEGFSPNWYEGQNNAGLSFYISPGSINGVVYPGSLQTLNIPINPQTGLLNSPVTVYFWLNSSGQIQQGLSLPASGPGLNVYPIAAVNAINVLTGTRPNGFSPQTTQAPGIAAVIDLRPITQTNFEF